MKEKIIKKLEEVAIGIIGKKELTMEEVNFIVFYLSRIEAKEAAEKAEIEREIHDKEWKGRMKELMGGMLNDK
jgi:menaquinone-dependent protoporphyrinogen IX oxidase